MTVLDGQIKVWRQLVTPCGGRADQWQVWPEFQDVIFRLPFQSLQEPSFRISGTRGVSGRLAGLDLAPLMLRQHAPHH